MQNLSLAATFAPLALLLSTSIWVQCKIPAARILGKSPIVLHKCKCAIYSVSTFLKNRRIWSEAKVTYQRERCVSKLCVYIASLPRLLEGLHSSLSSVYSLCYRHCFPRPSDSKFLSDRELYIEKGFPLPSAHFFIPQLLPSMYATFSLSCESC